MSQDHEWRPTGSEREGRGLYRAYMIARIGAERVKKKEMDVRREVQRTGTELVLARRKWEQWMEVAEEKGVHSVIDAEEDLVTATEE